MTHHYTDDNPNKTETAMQRVDVRFDETSLANVVDAATRTVEEKAEEFREEGRAEVRFEVQEAIKTALASGFLSVDPRDINAALDRAGTEA